MTNPEHAVVMEGRNLSLSYGSTRALDGASITIRRGKVHALVGNHSEGKSSLCRVLGGIRAPDSGELSVASNTRNSFNLETAAQMGVEFVDKLPDLFSQLSVAENIAMGEYRSHKPFWHRANGNKTKVKKWLSRFGISFPVDNTPSSIHPEEQCFVHMLSRLYSRPKLLILDESLDNLPSSLFAMSIDVLKKHVAEGMALLWVTHQLDSALKHADTISVLRYGKIISTEDAKTIEKRNLVRSAYLDAFGQAAHGGFYEFLKTTEAVLRDLPLAIVIVNKSGTLQYINSEGEKLFPGGGRAELGDDVSSLLGEKNAAILDIIAKAAICDTMGKSLILPLEMNNGQCLVSTQTCQVRDDGDLVGVMLIVQDVSEQEAMRQKLMLDHNLSSIGMLAAGVAHEVNNPLEALANYLRYLCKNPKTDKATALFLEMQDEVANIQKIICNLMSFSGRTSENRKSVDIFALAKELSSLIGLEATSNNIAIICHGPEEPAVIHADAGEIRQILLNLIRNSSEAMPGGGEIVISVITDDERVWMSFRDNGGGIKMHAINDIFLPFATTKNNTGTNQGLGLSIVRNLVDKHGGVISVNNLEQGCEFVISFPSAAKTIIP